MLRQYWAAGLLIMSVCGLASCGGIKCQANQHVVSNNCVDCPNGTTNTADDHASGQDTACDGLKCQANQHVVSNECVSCDGGTTNTPGDDASESDTACDPVLCNSNEHVVGNNCVSCGGGTTNTPGDDASGEDTTCDAVNSILFPRNSNVNRTGTVKVAMVLAHYNELGEGATTIDHGLLTGLYKTQPEAWGRWASSGRMTLEVTLFYHPLNMSERDGGGVCLGHPGMIFDQVTNLVESDFDVKNVFLLTTTGCSGGCASGQDGVHCTKHYDVQQMSTCDFSSPGELCSPVFIHEMLHALGLGYHQNAVQCSAADLAAAGSTWRDCTVYEYGGVFDVLGSGGHPKVSWGVTAKSRYDLGWMEPYEIVVVQKNDSPGAWTETTVDVTLLPLDGNRDTQGNRAAFIHFSDPTLSSSGSLWLEYRGGSGFDAGVEARYSGHNVGGVLGFHNGTALIDFAPVGEDVDVDDWFKVSLNPGAGVWRDPASGLELETLSAGPGVGATVRIKFGQPANCVRKAPSMNLPGYNGGYRFWLAKGDLALYAAPPEEGWPEVVIDDWIGQYMPYWGTPEVDTYQAIFSYMTSVKNKDSATCPISTMSIRGHALPDGWRVDEGACVNQAGGQGTTDVCFAVAVPATTPHGAYEILIEIFKEEDNMVSQRYPLWVCVGGFNPWFMAVANDRIPPWTCKYGDLQEGVEPTPASQN